MDEYLKFYDQINEIWKFGTIMALESIDFLQYLYEIDPLKSKYLIGL